MGLKNLKEQKIRTLWEKRADILPVKNQLLNLGWSYEFIGDVFEIPDFEVRIAKNEQKAVALADRLVAEEIYMTLKPATNGNYCPYMTDRFAQQVKAAIKKIRPLVKEESTGGWLCWFADIEECCCEKEECIRQMHTSIKPVFLYDSGGHEHIERCPICDVPFNDTLTWAEEEMRDEWDIEDDAFAIHVILTSMPTMDYEPSFWSIANRLDEALATRERFFQRVGALARWVLSNG